MFATLPIPLQRPAKWASLVVLVLALYALVGFFWTPRLINHYATEFVSDKLHRKLTLGAVHVNPFTLTLRVERLHLADKHDQKLVDLQGLLVNVQLSSLFTDTLHFKAIALDAPSINAIVNEQGVFNLNLSDSNTPKDNSPTKLPAIHIDSLQLRQGQVHVEDLSRPTPLRADFTPIEFSLEEFRTLPGHENGFHFRGLSKAKESFDWQGDFTLQPFGSKGKVTIEQLQAKTVQQYVGDALPVHLLDGLIGVQANYQLTLDPELAIKLSVPSIAMRGLQVAPKAQPDNAWIAAEAIQMNQLQLAFPQRTAHIKQIAINTAQVTAWFDGQHQLNLLDLIPPSEPNSIPWASSIDTIAINNASVPLEDRSVTPAARFNLSSVQAVLEHFSSAPGSVMAVDTTLRINDGGTLNAVGQVHMDTQQTQLKLSLDQFALKDLQPYAQMATDMRIESGVLTTVGELQYRGKATTRGPELQYQGDVQIAHLKTQDTVDNKDFINWQSLELKQLNYQMAPDSLDIAQVIARQPYGRFIIDTDGTTNIAHVLRIKPDDTPSGPEVKKASTAPKSSSGMRTRIARVNIEKGSLDFTDLTVNPNFATGIGNLSGTIAGLSSVSGSRAKIKLAGEVDRNAPVDISGEANFLAADTYSDISMNFRNMELTTFNPYSGKFAGYSIAKGKLATTMRYQIQDRKLNASHHIVIDQLEFGDATDSKDAVPLPVKFAVALLKDRHGVIDLELPISGSIDDPQFKVGPIIWKAFMGLLTKVVTSPFAALGHLFGGGDELAYVEFAPGSAVISTAEADKLNKLAQGMAERPQLTLDLPLSVVTETDVSAMGDAAFKQALSTELPNANLATLAQQLKALTSLYKKQLGKSPEWPASNETDPTPARIRFLNEQLKAHFAISPAEREALARTRANAVQQVLLMQPALSAERIFLTERPNEGASPDGVVRMQMKLQ